VIVENYEKQLQEVSFRFDGETAEIQEKLTMAFEIASSLRKLLDDKETLLQQLKLAKDQQEIQIIQLKSKLDQNLNKLENKNIELKELQFQFEEIKGNMQEYIK
jgi:chromosome segregation ATPase